jgi:hypothetical protein
MCLSLTSFDQHDLLDTIMASEVENGVLVTREELVDDIAARVRGYARYLAIVPLNQIVLYGVYRLPLSQERPRETYVHAAIHRDGYLGYLSTLYLTHDASHPKVSVSPRGLNISAFPEQDKPDRLMICNDYYDDPVIDEKTISLHMAQRLLGWLRHFDTLIPALEPSDATAGAIDAREDLYDRLGLINEGRMLF